MLEGLTTTQESNQVTLGLLFGYTTEEIDAILDRVEAWTTNYFTGC